MNELLDIMTIQGAVDETAGMFAYNKKLNTLTINVVYPYEVDLDSITTKTDLIGWIHHLAQKNWVNGAHIARFIEHVCTIKQWGIYR